MILVLLIFSIIRPKKDKTTIELRSKIEGDLYEFAK